MDAREVDVRKDRRRCRAADVTPAGVIVVCRSIDSPASSAPSPSTLTLLPILSLLPPSLPPSVFPFTLFSILTLLALSPSFLLPVHSTLLPASLTKQFLHFPLPSPQPLPLLLWGCLLSLIGRSPLFSCKTPFLLLSEMSPCRRGGTPMKQTAPQGVCFNGTHRSGTT